LRQPAWLWLNLLGLDAPLIALVWQDYAGRPDWASRAVLALTVWAIYLADRLLDVGRPASSGENERHRFCRNHRSVARILLMLALVADVIVACVWLPRAVFEHGLFVLAGVVIYFGAFPVSRRGAAAWKKPLAALLFTAGVFVAAWPGIGLAAAFFVLCLGNLLMVGNWGHSREPARGWIWMTGLSICCLRWWWPVSVSAAGLAVLSFAGRRIEANLRCVLADAVLLSPLLFR